MGATSKSSRSDFKSFEVPLEQLDKPKFQQPIFGANYLEGQCKPSPGEEGPLAGGPTPFSLTFNSGGCGTFLPLFFGLMAEVQERQASANSIAQAAQDGRLNQVAFVDPS